MKKTENPQATHLYNWISFTLKLSMAVSLVLLIIGLIMLSINGTELTKATIPLNQLWLGIIKLDPLAIITSGIVILLLVPLLGVTVAAIAFLVERDKFYLGISITVLCILLISLVLALT